MNSFALSLLFRTSGGNVPQIASLYILQQEELSPDDHAFLVERIEPPWSRSWRSRASSIGS